MGPGGEVEAFITIHRHVASGFTEVALNSWALATRVAQLKTLTADWLLIVMNYAAPFISNLKGVADGGLLSLCDRQSLVGGREEGTGVGVSCRACSTDVGTDLGTEGTLDSGTSGGGKFAPGDSALLRLD